MKYRLYDDGGDTEVFVMQSTGLGEPAVTEPNKFIFSGFSNEIHPYHSREMNWVVQMLNTAGIILNVKIVPTEYDISDDIDNGSVHADSIILPSDLRPSSDQNTYFLIHDKEMGRGWAVLMKIGPAGTREIIIQEHRDTVRKALLDGDFIRSFGIDYRKETVKDLSSIL